MCSSTERNQARTQDRLDHPPGKGDASQHEPLVGSAPGALPGLAKHAEQIDFQHRRDFQQREERGSRSATLHVADAGTTQLRARSERFLRKAALLAEFHQQLDQLGNNGRVRVEHRPTVGMVSWPEYALKRAGAMQSIMGAFLASNHFRKTAWKRRPPIHFCLASRYGLPERKPVISVIALARTARGILRETVALSGATPSLSGNRRRADWGLED